MNNTQGVRFDDALKSIRQRYPTLDDLLEGDKLVQKIDQVLYTYFLRTKDSYYRLKIPYHDIFHLAWAAINVMVHQKHPESTMYDLICDVKAHTERVYEAEFAMCMARAMCRMMPEKQNLQWAAQDLEQRYSESSYLKGLTPAIEDWTKVQQAEERATEIHQIGQMVNSMLHEQVLKKEQEKQTQSQTSATPLDAQKIYDEQLTKTQAFINKHPNFDELHAKALLRAIMPKEYTEKIETLQRTQKPHTHIDNVQITQNNVHENTNVTL